MRKFGIISLFYVFICALGFAQDFPGEYVSTVWTSAEGLPGNTINDILQSEDGYIYIATYDGLVRTDGLEFNVINRNTVSEFNCVSSRTLLQDSKKNIWIGSNDEGLAMYDGRHYRIFTTEQGLPNDSIRCTCEDKDGNIWAGTASGVCYITPDGKVVNVNDTAQYDDENPMCIDLYCDTAGRVWLITSKVEGIYCYTKGCFTKWTGLSPFGSFTYSAINQDERGAFWIGLVQMGAVKMDNSDFTFYGEGTPLEGITINTFFTDSERSLWIGTEKGVTLLRGNQFSVYDKSNGISGINVKRIIEDREGSIWIGTDAGGVEKMSLGKFTTYNLDSGVNAMAEDNSSNVWIGTDNGLLMRTKTGSMEKNILTEMCEGLRIRHVEIASNGDILVSTYAKHGQIRFNSKTNELKNWTMDDGLAGNKTRVCIERKSTGDLYVGTTSGLSIIRNDGTVSSLFTENGLNNNYIMCLMEDSDGRIWAGTDGGGINIIEDEQVVGSFTTKDGLAGNVIFKIQEDEKGIIWISTGAGLTCYEDGKFFTYTSKCGFASDSVFQIIEDYTDVFWLTSNRGIFSVKRKDLDDFRNGKIPKVYCKLYNKGDGLRSGGVTSTSLSMCDNNGRLWFTMIDGFAIYNPLKSKSSNVPPLVHIEEVKVDGENIMDFENMKIGPGLKRMDINYTALSFISPEMTRFRYILEGFDSGFSSAKTDRYASYTNLKHGSYTFKVQAADSNGNWNPESIASFKFTLKPYFYEMPVFWGICAALIIISIMVIVKTREHVLIEEKNKLEIMVQERTEALFVEKEKSDKLLLNILPYPIAQDLKQNESKTIADQFNDVTVLFSDIEGFTAISSTHTAAQIVGALNDLFSRFDIRAEKLGVEKIKTIGDSYMAVCGLPKENPDHAKIMISFALGMYKDLEEYNKIAEIKFRMRIGLNTGPVIAGVIGKTKFIYDMWGDTVNVASRMESCANPGEIRITESTRNKCDSNIILSDEIISEIKGKGKMITYNVQGKRV